MRIYLVGLVVLSACGFPRETNNFTCSVNSDCDSGRICEQGFCVVGTVDAPVEPDGARFDCTQWTPSPQHFMPCDIPQPTGPLTLGTDGIYTYDTGTGELTDPGSVVTMPATQMIGTSRLISVDAVDIQPGSVLRVIGTAPLIVAAWGDIAVKGNIDLTSTATVPGAGSNPTECAMHVATPGAAGGSGGGGSGGGGYRGTGGNGGDGDGGANNGIGGGLVSMPPPLLAGCSGIKGGDGDLPGGLGGAGGGGIQLTAQGMVSVDGKITAGGAGGEPGGTTADGGGGGGGGSGGMIGIEAATITIAGVLAANGGGGGQGGDTNPGGRGTDGAATSTRAPGGQGGSAGQGGQGSGGVGLNGGTGSNDTSGGGGGGGGGGAGFIVFKSASPATVGAATISPAQTVLP